MKTNFKNKKEDPKKIKKYFAWIRTLPCVICDQGKWIMDLGIYNNTVSHVLKKGSTRRDLNIGYVVPMCFKDHLIYENESKEKRLRFAQKAKELEVFYNLFKKS